MNDKEELPVPEGTILFIYLPTEFCSSTWIRMQTIFTQIKGAEVDIRVRGYRLYLVYVGLLAEVDLVVEAVQLTRAHSNEHP